MWYHFNRIHIVLMCPKVDYFESNFEHKWHLTVIKIEPKKRLKKKKFEVGYRWKEEEKRSESVKLWKMCAEWKWLFLSKLWRFHGNQSICMSYSIHSKRWFNTLFIFFDLLRIMFVDSASTPTSPLLLLLLPLCSRPVFLPRLATLLILLQQL